MIQTATNARRSRAFKTEAGLVAVLLHWVVLVSGQAPLGTVPLARSQAGSALSNVAVNPSGPGVSIQDIEAKLAEARAQLSALTALGEAGVTNVPAGISPQETLMRRALMHRLVRLYEQQLSNAAELETIQIRMAELVRQAGAWTGFSEPPPYSILLTDRLREGLQAERLKLRSGDTAVVAVNQLIEDNLATLARSEERIREINERLESAPDSGLGSRLAWQRELERLRSQVASAGVAVLNSDHRLREEGMAESRVRLAWLQRQLAIAESGAQFTHADLDAVAAQTEREREQLERELGEVQARRGPAFEALRAAREALRLEQARPEAGPAAGSRAAELVSAREAQLEAADRAIQVLRLMLEGVNIERTMWELRFAAYNSRNVATLSESERHLGAFIRRLDLWKERQRQQLDVSASEIQIQQDRLNNLAPDSEIVPLARERLAALRETDQMLLRLYRGIERADRLTQRWAEGLRAAERKLPFFGRVRHLLADSSSFLKRFWTFELFTAEDTITVDGQKITGRRGVTIGKIVLAILILGTGIWITGLIARLAEPIIVRRLKMEVHQASLIRRWMRAFMVACLVVFSLVSVRIPLTVFAFAGGALAIGLGFGMQTLLKNFVSGLILLFERPFRVSDVLDVAGQRGTVTSIGLRASVLQLWDGTELLIPNSSLLENNVTNWTYSNRKVRFTVQIGVAYESDLRQVMQLLEEAAGRHGLIQKEPKPQVLFTNFGDSTLTFELRYWVDVANANAAQVASDLRLMIAGSLKDHGIAIDYPQRDIHLHAAHPLPVRVEPNSDSRPES